MFTNLLTKLLGKGLVGEAVAEKIDNAIMDVADVHTLKSSVPTCRILPGKGPLSRSLI